RLGGELPGARPLCRRRHSVLVALSGDLRVRVRQAPSPRRSVSRGGDVFGRRVRSDRDRAGHYRLVVASAFRRASCSSGTLRTTYAKGTRMRSDDIVSTRTSNRAIVILATTMFVTGFSGFVFECILSTVATYVLGNSVEQFSITIGLMLACMGLGSWAQQ